jgi:hypothetical protein
MFTAPVCDLLDTTSGHRLLSLCENLNRQLCFFPKGKSQLVGKLLARIFGVYSRDHPSEDPETRTASFESIFVAGLS